MVGACLAAAATACSTFTPTLEGRTAVDGHHLWVSCAGRASPTVVVDAAYADDARTWRPLQERMRERVRVCVYDRAGYGDSDAGPPPRDAERVSGELRALLDGAGLEPPFVLVGHSLGALHALVFADRYPGVTAGLMLLDPPPGLFLRGERFPGLRAEARATTRALERRAEALTSSGDPDLEARGRHLRTLASEHRAMFGSTASRAAAVGTLDDLPLAVVASGRPDPELAGDERRFRRYWIEESRALAGLSSAGRFRLVEGSTHNLRADALDVVAEELGRLLDAAGAPD